MLGCSEEWRLDVGDGVQCRNAKGRRRRLQATRGETGAATYEKGEPTASRAARHNDARLVDAPVGLCEEARGAEIVHARLDVGHDSGHARLGCEPVVSTHYAKPVALRRTAQMLPRRVLGAHQQAPAMEPQQDGPGAVAGWQVVRERDVGAIVGRVGNGC